jgi:hypothetical protein
MAEFCRNCAKEILGDEHLTDFEYICLPGETTIELCEGCGGYIEVDHTGKRIRIVKKIVGDN